MLPGRPDVRRPPQAHRRRRPVCGSQVAQERAARARGRGTVRRLLAAGLAEFDARGFQAVTVDDIVHRADVSHGTFYLYFASKDDFFGVLSQEALQAMDSITDEFPVVTRNSAGRAALREWVSSFCDTYQAHAAVIRILSQADVVGQNTWENGLKHLFRLADVVSLGMTAGAGDHSGSGARTRADGARLNALACLMMLERVSYLLSSGIQLPRMEMVDRLTAIIVAAFHPPQGGGQDGAGWPARGGRQ